jgi:putative ABC transport system permease protein
MPDPSTGSGSPRAGSRGDWNRVVREKFASQGLDAPGTSDLVEEIALHLEDRYRELRNLGASDEEAYRAAVAELLDLSQVRADVDQQRRSIPPRAAPPGTRTTGHLIADLWQDIRYAGRTLRRSPLFVLVVVAMLALGIGANTTVFTVINTLFLNPLPVPDPSELAGIDVIDGDTPSSSRAPVPMSYVDLKDYQARNDVFASLAGYTAPRIVIRQDGAASERMFAELVTGNYFSTLRLTPSAGRFFLPEEEGTPGGGPVAVLNYGTWQTRFGGADVVGKSVRINNVVLTIVGIAPPHFIGVNAVFGPDMWIPASMAELLLPTEMQRTLVDRGKGMFRVVGRLKPGIGLPQAQADVATIASTIAREYPETDEGHTATLLPIRDALFASTNSRSNPFLFGSVVLLGVVGVVLLIACSNVANLLLARSATRRHEMALRLALGASRRRLVRQMLTESVCLGVLSGTAGLWVGYAGYRVLFASLPSSSNFIEPKLDATVFAFTAVISVLSGVVFGAVPAAEMSRVGVAEGLKEEAHTVGKSRSRVTLSNLLLVGQVAFSFLLLVLAALMLRSIRQAYDLDPGFQFAHLATFMTNPGQAGLDKARTRTFYDDVRDRVARIPGVKTVSWSSNLPLWARTVSGIRIPGWRPRSKADRVTTVLTIVDRDYFETAGIAIERGRAFTGVDQNTSTPVAIVNEKMAREYWPGGDALGKSIRLPDEQVPRQIVGIARTANYSSWAEAPQNCIYVPLTQSYSDAMTLFVRSTGDPQLVLAPVEREVRAAAPQVSVGNIRTGREIVDGGLFQAKVGVALLAVFGILALGLASIGLYGILAHSVSQRRREIGLRLALGATQTSVRGLILRQGMSLVVAGILLGMIPALLAARMLRGWLFGIGVADPFSVAAAAATLLAVALASCYLPARWATRVDPLVALRQV